MEDIVFVLMTIVLSLIYILTLRDFYQLYFAKNELNHITFLNAILIAYGIISVLEVVFATDGVFNIAVAFVILIVTTFAYKAPMLNRVIGAGFFLATTSVLEVIPPLFLSYINKATLTPFDRTVNWMMFGFIISRLVPFIGLKFYKSYSFSKNKLPNNSIKLKLFEGATFVLFPLCGIGIIVYLFQISYDLELQNRIYIGICMLLVTILILIFYLIYMRNLKLIELRTKEIFFDAQIELYAQNYENLKSTLNEFYSYKHDMKHRLLQMLSDLEIEEQEILKRFDMTFDSNLDYMYYSGNKTIDMVLNYNVNKAHALNIKPIINVNSSILINLDEKILSVILGNILDNAVESCEKYRKDCFIFEIKNQNGNLFISVENEFDGEIEFVDGFPKTTKDNTEKHGIGLRSINKIIEDNNGFMQLEVEDNIFKVQVLLANIV